MPSASDKVLTACSVWPCSAVPTMVTEPVGLSLMLATEAVALLVTDSTVPCRSV